LDCLPAFNDVKDQLKKAKLLFCDSNTINTFRTADVIPFLNEMKKVFGFNHDKGDFIINKIMDFKNKINQKRKISKMMKTLPNVKALPLREEGKQLMYIMIDLSGSMKNIIKSNDSNEKSRIDCVIDNIIQTLQKTDEKHVQNVDVVVLGFGFETFPYCYNGVRLPHNTTSIQIVHMLGEPLSKLRENIEYYRIELEKCSKYAGGGTPMLEALCCAYRTIENITINNQHKDVILFLITDGEPADAPFRVVKSFADSMRDSGIYIGCCFVSVMDDVGKKLYCKTPSNWSDPCKFLWGCASEIPITTIPNLQNCLDEFELDWELESDEKNGFRFFAHINHSQFLKEFADIFLM